MSFWLNGLGYDDAFRTVHVYVRRRHTAAPASAITFTKRLPFGIAFFLYVRLVKRACIGCQLS